MIDTEEIDQEELISRIRLVIAQARASCPHPENCLTFGHIHMRSDKTNVEAWSLMLEYRGDIYRDWYCEACESHGIQIGRLSWQDLIPSD